MKAWWQSEWQRARAQLEASPLLRVGLLAIPLIALLWLNLVLRDERAALHGDIASLAGDLADARQLAGQDEWTSRLDQARQQLEAQRQRLFGQADSEAFARADIQAAAQRLLAAAQLQRIRIEVSTAGQADPATGLIPLQLRLSGNAQGEQLYGLIAALESASPAYRIDNLNAQSQRGQHLAFSLVASVWYAPWGKG